MRIFVAHPAPEVAQELARRLREREGAEVKIFDNGLDLYVAVARAADDAALRPTLVIIDAAASRVGGLLLARLLKFHETLSRIPILVTTANASGRMGAEADETHVDALMELEPSLALGVAVELVASRVASIHQAIVA